jgi:type I restriction enzyme S subunit
METKSWPYLPFSQAVESHGSGSASLPQKEWSDAGSFPVIGQGVDEPEGWTDREDLLLTPSPAVVLYGGHTRRVKHVSHPFVPGPNVKILKPISGLDSKFLYYFLRQLPIESKGYADHFPLVRKFDVPVPPLAEQQRIVRLLDEAFEGIAIAKANAEKNLQNARAIFESYLNTSYLKNQSGRQPKLLGDLCRVKTGQKDVNEGNPKGVYPFFTCAENHTFSDSYSFDTEALLIAGNGNVGQVEYFKGKFEAYQRTYVLDEFRGVTARYLYHILKTQLSKAVSKKKLGTAMPYIKKGMLTDYQVYVPTTEEQKDACEQFDDLTTRIDTLARLYEQKVIVFEELKNSVMARYFSGQAEVTS